MIYYKTIFIQILSLTLLLLFNSGGVWRVEADGGYTITNFVYNETCLTNSTNGGCNLFDPANSFLWDVPASLSNTSNYIFHIDLSTNALPIDLEIVGMGNIELMGLVVNGGAQTQMLINGSSITITNPIVFKTLQLEIVSGAELMAPAIDFNSSCNVIMGQNSLIDTSSFPGDTVTLESDAAITLYETASIKTSSFVAYGTVSCKSNSVLYTASGQYDNLMLSNECTIKALDLLLTGTQSIIMGSLNSTMLTMVSGSNLTLTGASLNLDTIQFQPNSELILNNGHGFTYTIEMPASTTFGVFNSSFSFLGTNEQQSVGGNIVVEGASNLVLCNMSLVALFSDSLENKGNPGDHIFSTVVIQGAVSFSSPVAINSQVTIATNGVLTIVKRLELYGCVDNYGTLSLSNELYCYNSEYQQYPQSSLIFLGTPSLYAYELYNHGTWYLNTQGGITMYGNVNSSGSIIVQSGSYLNVINGHMDLTSGNYIQMDGVEPNTNYAVINVMNEIIMNGLLIVQLNNAPEYGNTNYNLFSTQIGIKGQFTNIDYNPSVKDNSKYEVDLSSYAFTVKYYGKEAIDPQHRDNDALPIVLSIFIPLLVISVIFTVLFYLYRRNKQYKFYTRIQ